jgi:hypothetical protein
VNPVPIPSLYVMAAQILLVFATITASWMNLRMNGRA